MPTITYRDLDVWKQGMALVEACRRAAISIPANVAEGHSRRETKPYRYHVSVAIGSHGELETYFELAMRLGFLSTEERNRLMTACDSVGRLLSGLHRALERKIAERSS